MTATNTGPGDADLRQQLESLVVLATGGAVTLAALRDCGGSLERAGVNSIAYINIIEALRQRYEVVVDPERDVEPLGSLDGLVALIHAAGRPRPAAGQEAAH